MKNYTSIKTLLSVTTDRTAAKLFIKEYCRLNRWNAKAEKLFVEAFPNAWFSNDVGLNKGKSGTVRAEDGKVYVHACARSVRSKKTGYVYNRSRAWVIPVKSPENLKP